MFRNTIDTLSVQERDVADKQGRGYSLRIRPYRTADNKIDGAVMTLVDHGRKRENARTGKGTAR